MRGAATVALLLSRTVCGVRPVTPLAEAARPARFAGECPFWQRRISTDGAPSRAKSSTPGRRQLSMDTNFPARPIASEPVAFDSEAAFVAPAPLG